MAEELKTVLGFDAAKAIQTVRELTASLNAYSVSMKGAAKATSSFNRSAKGFEQNALAVNKAVGRTGQVANNSAKAINTFAQQTKNAAKPVKKLAETTKRASKEMLLSWKSIVRIFAIQVIHQAISKISGALRQSAEDSREYVKALSEIRTISEGGFGGLENLAAQVEEFAAATGQPLTAVTEGIYQILSNQVADAAGSFELLQAASDFSIASVTDLGSSVELLSSIINSYQLNASDAADISGKLFRAIDLGRFRGEEIAETIGRITVLSSQLGVTLEETLASITVLTRSGMKYNEAFTLVSNIQLKLIKPTQALKNLFKEMGIASSEAGIQAYGFQGLLAKIEENAGSTASELGNLYGRVRAIRGALGLGSKYMETYTSDLKQLREAAAETIEEAKEIIFETNAKQVELELNKLNIALIGFGRGATDVTKIVFDSFGGAIGTIQTFTTALTVGGVTWLLLRGNALKSIKDIVSGMGTLRGSYSSILGLGKQLIKSPILWAAAVAIAVTAISYALNRYIRKAKEARDALAADLISGEKIGLINYKIELTEQVEGNKKILGEVQKMLFAKQKLYNNASSKIRQTERFMFGSLEDQLSDHISAVKGLYDGLKDIVADLPSKLKSIAKETYDINVNINDWEFERSIKGLNKVEEANQRINRSHQWRNEAAKAAVRGEYDLTKQINEKAMSEADAALAIADQIGDKKLITKAEQASRAAMRDQLSLQKKIKEDTISQAEAVEKQLKAMERLVRTLEQQEDQYKKLIKQLEKTTDPVDRKKILAKLKLVAKDIEATIGKPKMNVEFANSEDLSKELVAVSQSFYDSLTGQVKTFEQAVTDSVTRTNALRAKTPDVSEQQATAVEMGKQLDTAAKAMVAQEEAQGKIDTAVKSTTANYDIFVAALAKASVFQEGGAVAARETGKLLVFQLGVRINKAKELAAAGKANTTEYTDQLTEISRIRNLVKEKLPGIGVLGLGDPGEAQAAITDILNGLTEIVEQQGIIKAEGEKAEVGKGIMDKIKDAPDEFKAMMKIVDEAATNTGTAIGVSISTGIQTATTNVQSGTSSQISALKSVAAQARITAAAVASVGSGGTAASKASGGMMYRAGGGFTPRGTDTIPAMLSPGEFVVNAASSRRFFSQLVAMNSGRQPVYRAEGGSVGDISINVTESKSPHATAKEVASEIRRGIQRKTIRKF